MDETSNQQNQKEQSDEQEQEELKKQEQEDQEIQRIIGIVSETNKKIDDEYDERIKKLEDKKKLVPEEHEQEKSEARIAVLQEKLKEIKAKVSDARKSGKDPFIADLILRNVKAKIKMAQVTHDEKDYKLVETILNKAEQELEEALKQEEIDVKKEIMMQLRSDIAKETGKVIET